MRRWTIGIAVALMALAFTFQARAEGPAIGKAAPAFELKGSDDKTHTLADYKGKIVVITFEGTKCPWDRAYQPMLTALANKHKDKVVFLGINANHSESLDEVKSVIAKEKIPYAILKDPGNKIADAYAAHTTPHIYVIDGEGVLRYKGGIEKAPNSPGGAGKSSEQYLGPVLAALVEGKEPPVTETKSIGCSIKREK